MAMTYVRPDIQLVSPSGAVVAAIEVKNPVSLSPEIAAQWRANLAGLGFLERADYFLLISEDAGYIWDQRRVIGLDAPPTARFPMSPVLDRYWSRRDRPSRLVRSALELLIAQWLNELAGGGLIAENQDPALVETGFLRAIRDARVEFGVEP